MGLTLPGLTRVMPWLVVWAAVGTGLLAGATALIGLRILYASDLEWETGIPD